MRTRARPRHRKGTNSVRWPHTSTCVVYGSLQGLKLMRVSLPELTGGTVTEYSRWRTSSVLRLITDGSHSYWNCYCQEKYIQHLERPLLVSRETMLPFFHMLPATRLVEQHRKQQCQQDGVSVRHKLRVRHLTRASQSGRQAHKLLGGDLFYLNLCA